MSNLYKAFGRGDLKYGDLKYGKAFIPFITCGDPDLATTEKIIYAMAENGASLIELGIPFSDPVAEGVVIQEANMCALKNGVRVDHIFEMLDKIKQKITIPMAFMTYANLVFAYGSEKFLQNAKDVGIGGLILPDVPFEEKGEFEPICVKNDIDLISFIAPTSKDRIEMIAKEAKGFIYCVSSLGVTGVRKHISTDIKSIIKCAREVSKIPVAVGFGIESPSQAKEIAEYADGVIVGSAIVKLCAKYGEKSPEYIGKYVKEMRKALG